MKKSKVFATGLGVAAATGTAVSMVRAATTYKAKPVSDGQKLEAEKVDVDRYVKHLSQAIQIPTIANRDESLVDWSKFDEFHSFLESAYPLIHENIPLLPLNRSYALIYWLSHRP